MIARHLLIGAALAAIIGASPPLVAQDPGADYRPVAPESLSAPLQQQRETHGAQPTYRIDKRRVEPADAASKPTAATRLNDTELPDWLNALFAETEAAQSRASPKVSDRPADAPYRRIEPHTPDDGRRTPPANQVFVPRSTLYPGASEMADPIPQPTGPTAPLAPVERPPMLPPQPWYGIPNYGGWVHRPFGGWPNSRAPWVGGWMPSWNNPWGNSAWGNPWSRWGRGDGYSGGDFRGNTAHGRSADADGEADFSFALRAWMSGDLRGDGDGRGSGWARGYGYDAYTPGFGYPPPMPPPPVAE